MTTPKRPGGLRQVVIVLAAALAILRIVTCYVRKNVEADRQHWAKAVENIGNSPESLCRTECAVLETREQPDADVFGSVDLTPCSNVCLAGIKNHWGGDFEPSYRECRHLCRDRTAPDANADGRVADGGGAFTDCLGECVETHLRAPPAAPSLPPRVLEAQKVAQEELDRLRREVEAKDGG
jgi:hypothetical protein